MSKFSISVFLLAVHVPASFQRRFRSQCRLNLFPRTLWLTFSGLGWESVTLEDLEN